MRQNEGSEKSLPAYGETNLFSRRSGGFLFILYSSSRRTHSRSGLTLDSSSRRTHTRSGLTLEPCSHAQAGFTLAGLRGRGEFHPLPCPAWVHTRRLPVRAASSMPRKCCIQHTSAVSELQSALTLGIKDSIALNMAATDSLSPWLHASSQEKVPSAVVSMYSA